MKYDIYNFIDSMEDAKTAEKIGYDTDNLITKLYKKDISVISSMGNYESLTYSSLSELKEITDWVKVLLTVFEQWKVTLEKETNMDLDKVTYELTENDWGDFEVLDSNHYKRDIKYENGIIARISYDNEGNVILTNYRFGKDQKPINIFGDYNIKLNQYGGNQSDVYSSLDLLEDRFVLETLKESYPDRTLEEYQLYLKKIGKTGCGYTGIVNAIFKKYEGKENEFEEIFGFPMYTVNSEGDINFNYEHLIIDSFVGIWKDSGYTFEQLVEEMDNSLGQDASITGETSIINTGLNQNFTKDVVEYLNNKYDIGLEVHSDMYYCQDDWLKNNKDLTIPLIKHYQENYDCVLIGAAGYDIYTEGGYSLIDSNGAHMMYVTEVTDDGKIIVSSWGRKVELGVQDSRQLIIYGIKYK